MWRGRGRRGRSTLGVRSRRTKPTMTETTRMVQAARAWIGRRRFPWGRFRRMVLGYTMYMGMYGTGWRTAGTGITRGRRRTGVRGRLAAIVGPACCAAVPGSTNRGSCGPPTAAGSPPGTGTAAAVSVLPERSPRESLRLYIMWGTRGLRPLVDFHVSPGSCESRLKGGGGPIGQRSSVSFATNASNPADSHSIGVRAMNGTPGLNALASMPPARGAPRPARSARVRRMA